MKTTSGSCVKCRCNKMFLTVTVGPCFIDTNWEVTPLNTGHTVALSQSRPRPGYNCYVMETLKYCAPSEDLRCMTSLQAARTSSLDTCLGTGTKDETWDLFGCQDTSLRTTRMPCQHLTVCCAQCPVSHVENHFHYV